MAATLLALRLKQRLFGAIEYRDALIPAIFLTAAQYEILVITPNPAYSGFPLLLLMLYLLALLQTGYRLKYGIVLTAHFLMIYTGFGIFIGPLTIGVFALVCYRSWRGIERIPFAASAAGFILACASLASFFIDYKFVPAVDCFVFPSYPLRNYPWFVTLMFSTFAGLRSHFLMTALERVSVSFAVWIFAVEARRATRAKSSQLALTMAI